MAAQDIVVHDAEVVFGDVGEVRAAGTVARGPDIGRCCFQALIHFYVSAVGGFHSGQVQANAGGVGRAPGGDEQMRAFQDEFRAVALGV